MHPWIKLSPSWPIPNLVWSKSQSSLLSRLEPSWVLIPLGIVDQKRVCFIIFGTIHMIFFCFVLFYVINFLFFYHFFIIWFCWWLSLLFRYIPLTHVHVPVATEDFTVSECSFPSLLGGELGKTASSSVIQCKFGTTIAAVKVGFFSYYNFCWSNCPRLFHYCSECLNFGV